jgi:2,3-bisphosphoglycerate-independent phosphoglycerate mutase
LMRATKSGRRAKFLNAYDDERIRHVGRVMRGEEKPSRRRPPSASSWAALAGGGSLSTFDDVRAGRAATFDLTGETLRSFGVGAPAVTLKQAARAVAAGAREVDVSLFEIFTTDMAGHSRDITWARAEVTKLDRFLGELFAALSSDQLVVVTSDHGNLEDLSTKSHTRAPVPLLAYGKGASEFVQDARDLRDVAPRLLAVTDGR